MNETAKLTYDVYIAAPAAKVWQGLTDGACTPHYYFGTRLTSTFEKGAPVTFVGGDGASALEGRVLEFEPERRLSTTWHALWDESVARDEPSRVVWELTPMGDVTRLTVVHDQLDAKSATYAQSAGGWPVILSGLKTYLETGKPLRLP